MGFFFFETEHFNFTYMKARLIFVILKSILAFKLKIFFPMEIDSTEIIYHVLLYHIMNKIIANTHICWLYGICIVLKSFFAYAYL